MVTVRRLLVAFLLVASPVFAERRELEDPAYGPSLYGASDARVAYAAGRFLTVWSAVRGSVWGVLHDADGRQITEHDFPIPTGASPSSLQLFADGDRFVLIWKSPYDALYLTEIDRDGTVTSQKRLDDLDVSDLFLASFNGTAFLIQPDGITLDRNGNLLSRDVPRASFFEPPIASFAIRNGFLLGVSSRLVQLSSNGAQIANTTIPGCEGCALFDAAAIDDDSTLVVVATPAGLASAILERNGTLTPLRPLPSGSARPRSVALEHFGSDYRLFFRTSDLLALTLDSAGAPRELSPVVIATGIPSDRDFDAASNDRVTLLVQSKTSNDWDVHAYAVTELRPTPASQLVIAPAMQIDPMLAPCADSFISAWTVVTRSGPVIHSEIHYAALDRTGVRTTPIRSDQGVSIAPTLAWNGSEALLLRQQGPNVIATRIACSGEKLSDTVLYDRWYAPNPLPGFQPFNGSAAWSGTHWIVVWLTERGPQVATISAAGVLGTVRSLDLAIRNTPGATRQIGPVAIASNGKIALLVFDESEAPCGVGSCDFKRAMGAVRLGLDGTPIDTTPKVLPEGSPSVSEITIATDGGSDFRVVRNGLLIGIGADERELRIGTARTLDGRTSIQWDSAHYLVATARLRYIYLTRLTRDGIETGIRRVIDVAGAGWHHVAATRSGDVLLAVEEATRPERAVTWSGDDARPIPLPPDEPTSVSLASRPGGSIEVSWTPPARTDNVDGYVVETWWQGEPSGVTWVGPEKRSVVLSRGDRARVRAYNAGGMSGDSGPRRRSVARR